MQSASARIRSAEDARQRAFEVFDQKAAVAQASAPRASLNAGLGQAILSTSRAAAWREGVRDQIAELGATIRSAIRESGETIELVASEAEEVTDLARFLRGEVAEPPTNLPPDLVAAAISLRASDPALAVTMAASVAETAKAVTAQSDRARNAHAIAAAAGEVARHRAAAALHRLAGEDRLAKAAGLLGERASLRVRDLRKAAAR